MSALPRSACDRSVPREHAPEALRIPAPRTPVDAGTASGTDVSARPAPQPGGPARVAYAPGQASATEGRAPVADDRAPAAGRLRRNRIWAAVGHAGTVVTLAAALAICASIALRVDGPSVPARADTPPSSAGGSPDAGAVSPVPLGRR